MGHSKALTNSNQMMETEFVSKVKEEKNDMTSEILEAERQVLLWERKITLEKEMQEALDPNVGQADSSAMKKEIHRMELRLDQLKRRQEQMIIEMERAVHKRDAIALKYEPKAKKSKQAATTANLKRQVQSLRNNLRLCTTANSDIEQKIGQRETDLAQLQQTIEQSAEEYNHLERAAETLRADVQVRTVEKQHNLADLLKLQRAGKRCDELALGTGPPPAANVRQVHSEQLALKRKIEDVIKVLHDAYPQLEPLWAEFYSWLEVQAG